MTAPAHTPTPWRVFTTKDGRKLIGVGGADGEGILDAGFGVWSWNDADGIANAELAVRAVNSHADMLAACKDCLEGRGDWIPAMAAAIAKAEGRA